MSKKLYVNLFKEIDSSHTSSIIEEKKNSYYLDFHSKPNNNTRYTTLIVENISNFSTVYDEAVSQFTLFVAKLSKINISKKNIRDFTINGIPLFWLTTISEKHYFHWLMKFFLLKEIISSDSLYLKDYKSLTFIIPSEFKTSKKLIEDLFCDYKINITYTIVNLPKKNNIYVRLFKNLINTIVSFLKMKQPKLTNKESKFVFLLPNVITEYTKDFFENIISLT
mgnify:CR=1 FL=1